MGVWDLLALREAGSKKQPGVCVVVCIAHQGPAAVVMTTTFCSSPLHLPMPLFSLPNTNPTTTTFPPLRPSASPPTSWNSCRT